ncbi:hypothetical protein [Streptomyces sp. NBC_01296]|uniref:hypothetical protein n=1 Tax=Streptomyces sp. NBC_01296 TaxID=2903816 RepID=UPI002E15F3A2|nr:hypothetical protein OG299_00295 [Streptomyces sp. NBC_01296]
MQTSQSNTSAPTRHDHAAEHPAADFVRAHGPTTDWQPLDFELYLDRFSTPNSEGLR